MSHPHSDADWDSVTVLRKSSATLRKQAKEQMARGGASDAKARYGAGQNRQTTHDAHSRKLDENTDGGRHNTVSHGTSTTITKTRAAKGLTREQLAQKVNIKSSVLVEYETGKAIPNQQILNKLERVLGVYLRGEKCGQEKTSTKKSSPKKSAKK